MQNKSVFVPLLVYVTYFGIGGLLQKFNSYIYVCIEEARFQLPGPWYVGEVLTGVYGTVSAHGVNVVGHHLPGAMTYLHGILQVSSRQQVYNYSQVCFTSLKYSIPS